MNIIVSSPERPDMKQIRGIDFATCILVNFRHEGVLKTLKGKAKAIPCSADEALDRDLFFKERLKLNLAASGMATEIIDIVIRHGGRMDFSGTGPKYVGGEESVVGFDTDYLSYRILNACAKEDLGYTIVHQRCGWRVYGSWNSKKESFLLKCLGANHTCPRALENKQASAKWIAKTYIEKFRISPKWDVSDMKRELQLTYGIRINDNKCYRARNEARILLEDSVESNVCESFNNAITRFRDLRIIKLLEGIRTYIMVRMVDQHKAFAAMKDVICPTILEQIEWTKIQARTCIIQPSLDGVLECTDHGRGFVVDLRQSRCTCGYWQLSGVPCLHGIAAMSYMRYDFKGYVNEWYSVQLAKKAYTKGIPPLPGREDWIEVDGLPVLPPPYRVMPGRPKKNRRKEPGEVLTRPS
ncbi:hypothetical protein LINPERHAP1_LOCUS22370, partial [Linum perenne]